MTGPSFGKRQLGLEARPKSDPLARPRILLVTDRGPANDSGYSIRVNNVIRGLKRIGDLHVCLIDSSTGGMALPRDEGYSTSVIRAEEPSKQSKALAGVVHLSSLPYRDTEGLRRAIHDELGQESWDLVWFSRLRSYCVARGLFGSPTIVDFDDLNDRLATTLIADRVGRRGHVRSAPRNLLGLLAAGRWSQLQHRVSSEVDRVVVCSEADRSLLDVENATVVPNGYGIPRAAPQDPATGDPKLLFVGPLSYEPNLLAAEWLAFDVLPILRERVARARISLVGYNQGVSRRLVDHELVDLAGYVHDLGPYFAEAAVAVAPLNSGGGTRLKVIEALARSVPLVSTPLGCYGFDLVHDRELLIASDPRPFADACASIIEDPALGQRLAAAGLERYRETYTAKAASGVVAELAADVIETGH